MPRLYDLGVAVIIGAALGIGEFFIAGAIHGADRSDISGWGY